jgi:hypothetical protein
MGSPVAAVPVTVFGVEVLSLSVESELSDLLPLLPPHAASNVTSNNTNIILNQLNGFISYSSVMIPDWLSAPAFFRTVDLALAVTEATPGGGSFITIVMAGP